MTTAVVLNVEEMIEFAKDGIVSKTILDQPEGKVVLFCMSAGQSLSEHTASMPATVYILRGKGTFRLGAEDHPMAPGVWLYMPAQQVHAVHAKEDLVFLLTLFREGEV